MHRFIRRIAVAALAVAACAAQAATLELAGRVSDEDGRPLQGATVSVNGVAAQSDAQGRFAARVEAAAVYRLQYGAEGHYPVIHTYSPLEFDWWSDGATGGSVALPEVSLVARAPGRVMLAFGGDAMMGRRYADPYPGEPVLLRPDHRLDDARALLRHVKPYLEAAEFASVNLETQVMEQAPEGKAPKSYVFYTPPEAVTALREAGVDYVTLGNNHTNDYLADGLASTLDVLRAEALPFSGAGLNETDALAAHRTQIGGAPFSFLGYVGWAGNFSPNQVASGADKSGAAFGTTENIVATVRREAAAGHRPVIQYHGSREYADEPTLVTETRLKRAIDEGAALAIAHHPHVVQGFEIYRGRLVAYSLGNFMFDQFHYATQYSYMVWVWLDDDRLHRAEVVPIHIQGYTPMPATDTVRRKVLRRTLALSARRGVVMETSGGHGVIRAAAQGRPATDATADLRQHAPAEIAIVPLHDQPWQRPATAFATAGAPPARFRLGENLLPTGHLENHFLHGSPDRSWIEDGMQAVAAIDDAPSGRHAMRLDVPAGAGKGRVGMRTFEYTFEPGTPTTFQARARFSGPATVTAYQQWRGRNDDRFEALANNRLRAIGRIETAGGGWQELRFDFDSPRVSAISYRVVLEVEPAEPTAALTAWFDDLALVEWLTPPLDSGPLPPHASAAQASHVELIPAAAGQ
jgi:poly-gamma-glutamate capsule biosynthesis protein CapA/YwtB (metallophosphatase superfamily)